MIILFDKNNKLKYLYINLQYKVNYFNTKNILKFYIIEKLKIMIFKYYKFNEKRNINKIVHICQTLMKHDNF